MEDHGSWKYLRAKYSKQKYYFWQIYEMDIKRHKN